MSKNDIIHVGSRYEGGYGRAGKILLVGQSGTGASWEPVANAIHLHRTKKTTPFFTRIQQITFGTMNATFWDRVAYTDFIAAADDLATKRLAGSELSQAADALASTIFELRPNLVIAFSNLIWNYFDKMPYYSARLCAPGELYAMTVRGVTFVAASLPHPTNKKFPNKRYQAYTDYCVEISGQMRNA